MTDPLFRTIVLYLLFSFLPLVWLIFLEKKKLKDAVHALGFGKIGKKDILPLVGWGVTYAVLLTLLIEVVIAIFTLIGLNDVQNVTKIVVSLPTYLLILAITIAPITEEIAFRGFLRPKLGIILSSLVYLPFHSVYNSMVEYAGVFVASVVFCYILDKHKNIGAPMLTHIIYNAVALARMGII